MRIKICGLTNVADAVLAAELGADALGLNFYPPSKRFLAPATALAILRELPPFVTPVGLFVNQSCTAILDWLSAHQLDLLRTLQLHGDTLEPTPAGAYRFIPAFAVRDRLSLQQIENYLHLCRQQGTLPTAILVDAAVPGEYGGTGQVAPWHLLADFRPGVPLILAGGLTPDNVAEAIRLVRPHAVDVASGVESSPGRKDKEKMQRFISQARAAWLSGPAAI